MHQFILDRDWIQLSQPPKISVKATQNFIRQVQGNRNNVIGETIMDDVKTLIAEKKAKLEALKASRPKGGCSEKISSLQDVARETAIEELEDEIRSLVEKQ